MNRLLLSAIVVLLAASTTLAGTLANHTGATDPVAQGWTEFAFQNTTRGPVLDDQGSGIDSWFVDDNGTAIGDAGGYLIDLSAEQVALAAQYGWRLAANVRVAEFPDPAPGQPGLPFDASPVISYRDGAVNYAIHLGAQADGDPIVFLPENASPNGRTIVMEGSGPGYHLYEIVRDPADGEVDVFVDGVEVASDYVGGTPVSTSRVLFGAGSSCCTGRGHFNLVRFDVLSADHFMAYKVKTTKGTPKPAKFGPVTLADQFRTANYDVIKSAQLLLPADKNGEGRIDEETHLQEYKIKPVGGSPAFGGLTNVRVVNQCHDLLVQVGKPTSLLVPTSKSLVAPPGAPGPSLDHYLCYKAGAQKKDASGNKLPGLPKGTQVDVVDQFQERRYDLKKITKLCNPVDKSGAPVFLNGPNKGDPKPITPAAIASPETHLVCYQAKLAKKLIAQTGCGATDPADKGVLIEPKQDKHAKLSGVSVANQFGDEQLDTVKEFELCIPSTKSLE